MAESGDGYVTYEEEFTQIWEEVQDEVDKARALDFSPKLFTKGKCQMCSSFQREDGWPKKHDSDWELVACPNWARAMEEFERQHGQNERHILHNHREEHSVRRKINSILGNKFASLLANCSAPGDEAEIILIMENQPCAACRLVLKKTVVHPFGELINCKAWWKVEVLFQLMEPAYSGPQAWAAVALMEAVGEPGMLMFIFKQLAARAALEARRLYRTFSAGRGEIMQGMNIPVPELPVCYSCFKQPQPHKVPGSRLCNNFTSYWNLARRQMDRPAREMMVARVAFRKWLLGPDGLQGIFYLEDDGGTIGKWPRLVRHLQLKETEDRHEGVRTPRSSWVQAIMMMAVRQIGPAWLKGKDCQKPEEPHQDCSSEEEEMVEKRLNTFSQEDESESDSEEEYAEQGVCAVMERLRRPDDMARALQMIPQCPKMTKELVDKYFDLPYLDVEEAAFKYLTGRECLLCKVRSGPDGEPVIHTSGWAALSCGMAVKVMAEHSWLGGTEFFAKYPSLDNWEGRAEIAQRTELNSLIREFMRQMLKRAARTKRDQNCKSCRVLEGGVMVEHETDQGLRECKNAHYFAKLVSQATYPTNAIESAALMELTNLAGGWALEILAETQINMGYEMPHPQSKIYWDMNKKKSEPVVEPCDPGEPVMVKQGDKECVDEDNMDEEDPPDYQDTDPILVMEEGGLLGLAAKRQQENCKEKMQRWGERAKRSYLGRGLCGLGQLGMVIITLLMLTNPHMAAELPNKSENNILPISQPVLCQQPLPGQLQGGLAAMVVALVSAVGRSGHPEVLLLVTILMPLAGAEEEDGVEMAVPMWADAKDAVNNPADGTTILPSWRAAVAYDTSGKFSGVKPKFSLYPLVEEESCQAEKPAFKEPVKVRGQVMHVREHQDVQLVACSGIFSYEQLFCSVGFYSHREAPITVMPETMVELSAEQCRQMYYKGSAVVSVYESSKDLGNEVDTVVFVTGLQNGTTTKVDLVAGYEEENNACTGQAFNFYGDHYWKHMLYRKTTFTIYTYTGQYYDRTDEIAVKNLVDIPPGQNHVVDEKYGTVVLVSDVVRKKERCRRATELFTAVGEFHPRQEDPAKGVLFIRKKKKETTFVVTGRIKACERIIWQTSVRSVYVVPLFEDNPKLEVIMHDEPDMVAEVEHQLAATAAATVYQMNNNLQKVRENACQMNRAAKWNTRTALMSADNSQLANIILGGMASYAGAAFSVVMGTPVRVNFMNYRPTADTDGICCEEIPVTFLDRMKNRVFAFMKAISRVLVEHCTPVPCSASHPIVQAIWGEDAVRAVMTDTKNTTWTWPKVMKASKTGSSETRLFYMCDIGDGNGFKYCKIPKKKLWMEKELSLQVGYDHVMDNLVSTIWDPESEEMLYKIQQDMSNHAVLHRELSTTANGHSISGGLMGKLIDNAPDKVKEDVWSSFLSYNTLTNKKSVAYKLLMGVVISISLIVAWILAVCCCNTYSTIQMAFYNMWLSCKNCTKKNMESVDEENFPMVARRHKNICHDIDSCLELIAKLEQNEIRNDRRLTVLEDKVKQGAGLLAMHCEHLTPSAPPVQSDPVPVDSAIHPANVATTAGPKLGKKKSVTMQE